MKGDIGNNQPKKSARYQHNYQEKVKFSNFQPKSSTQTHQDEFNLTFLIKDYDQANPYLNKNSLRRGKLSKREREAESSILFEQHLLNVSPICLPQLSKKKGLIQQVKLPNINKKSHHLQIKHNNLQHRQHNNKKTIDQQESFRFNRSVTMNTRVQTDDASIVQGGSSSTLLKMETNSIDTQAFSCLKISKIVNPEIDEINRDILERYNLVSRDVSGKSLALLAAVSPCKAMISQVIAEEESTSESSEEEYVKDSVPGPGYYSVSQDSQFSNNKKRNTSISLDFGSRASRFNQSKTIDLNDQTKRKLQAYQQKQRQREQRLISLNKRGKKYVPFNCKEQSVNKIVQKSYTQKMISPMYYNPRNGIEEELISKIQKNFRGNFGVSEKRFKTVYRRNYNLGPGSYCVDLKNDEEQSKKQDFFFLSKKERFQ